MNREHARARAGALAHLSTLLLLSSGLSGVAPRPAEAQKAPVKQPPLEVRLIHAIEKQDEPKVRALLQAGADVNRRTEEGHAPLDYAAAFGSVPLCRLLIERGAQVNPAENHYPPLYQAIAANHLGVAQLLVEKGASLKWPEVLETTPLRLAAGSNSPAIIDFLLKRGVELDSAALLDALAAKAGPAVGRLLEAGADPNVRNEDGETPLILAAEAGRLDLMEVLLKHKADVNAKDAIGKTALMHAAGPTRQRIITRLKQAGAREFEPTLTEATKQGDSRAVRALLERGQDANEPDPEGRTPLFHAAKAGDENLVKALLEKGANPEARDKQGKSVLEVAKQAHNEEVVRLLLDAGVESPELDLAEALRSSDLEAAKRLVSMGVDVNSTDERGTPLLLVALTPKSFEPFVAGLELLLEHGANPNAKDPINGHTPLITVASSGEGELARKLLDRGADPRVADDSGWTALHYVSGKKGDPLARLLIERGADIRAKTSSGMTVLLSLAGDASPELMRDLLTRGAAADVRTADDNGTTPLHAAAGAGNAAVVKLLLERGADPRQLDQFSKTSPLGSALSGSEKEGDYLETIRLLLKAGADPNGRDDLKHTMLDLAKQSGSPQIIDLLKRAGARSSPPPGAKAVLMQAVWDRDYATAERLLRQKKVDPNQPDAANETPLVRACRMGDLQMVQLLLSHGAQPNQRVKHRADAAEYEPPSALYEAAEEGEIEIMQLLLKRGADPNARWLDETPLMAAAQKGQLAACRLLIAAGANVNAQFEGGRTPLSVAAMLSDTRILKLLLQKGARVDVKVLGSTPLLVATNWGNLPAARVLIEAGANVQAKTADGYTTLMGAASLGNVELIQLLLAKGADVNARNERNQTALSLAQDNGQEEAAELLKRAGAKP